MSIKATPAARTVGTMSAQAGTRTVRTICPLDCWDACGMLAHVEGDRVVRLEGDPEDPIAQGKLCSRTYRYPERVHDAQRILHPMRRTPAGWLQASWEDALDEISGRLEDLRRHNRTESVLHVQSAGSMGILKDLSHRFWNLYGGVTFATGDFCLGAGKTALIEYTGDYSAHAWEDIANSRLVYLWGRDPFGSGPHRVATLKAAKEQGVRIVSINPVRIARSSLIDDHVLLRPGSDGWLALGIARVLLDEQREDAAFLDAHTIRFESLKETLDTISMDEIVQATGLTAERIVALARAYGDAKPAAILLGTGPIRYRGGLEAASLISTLPAIAGYYGKPGGGLSYTIRHHRGTRVPDFTEPGGRGSKRRVSAGTWPFDIEKLDPPIEVLWVNGANPAAMLPDARVIARAIDRIPLKVVVDFHWTDTARLSDWVLPHPSFLEEEGLITSWGHTWVGYQEAALSALGSAHTDLEIFQTLASRLGFGDEMAGDAATWSRRLAGERINDAEWDAIRRADGLRRVRSRVHEPVPFAIDSQAAVGAGVPGEGSAVRFSTPDGRYHFPDTRPDLGDLPNLTADRPFLLLTPKSRERHLSQDVESRQPVRLDGTMGRAVAAMLGFAKGNAMVRSDQGAIPVHLELDDDLLEFLLVVPLGGAVHRGTSVNLVTARHTARDGVTPAYFDCAVSVEPIGDPS